MTQQVTYSHKARKRRGQDGFTLMEVALAVAVIAVGIMALFALMSSGLEFSSEAVNDTMAANFADNTFNTLRSRSAEAGLNGTWDLFWWRFTSPLAAFNAIEVAATSTWRSNLRVRGNGGIYTNVFVTSSLHGSTLQMENHSLRYQCRVNFTTPRPATPPASPDVNNVARVTLYVWPEQFGRNDRDDALVFYTEFNNPGDL